MASGVGLGVGVDMVEFWVLVRMLGFGGWFGLGVGLVGKN